MRPSVRQTQDCGVSGCSWVPSGGRDARMAADIILWWTLSSCRGECYMRVGVWRAWGTNSGSHNYQSGCALKVFAFGGWGVVVDSCLYQKSAMFHSQPHAESLICPEINRKTYKPKLLGCNITARKHLLPKFCGWRARACVRALAPPGARPPTLRRVRGNALVYIQAIIWKPWILVLRLLINHYVLLILIFAFCGLALNVLSVLMYNSSLWCFPCEISDRVYLKLSYWYS